MLTVKETVKVELKTEAGDVLREGMRIIYRDKNNRDLIAEYQGYEKGLIKLVNVSNGGEYNIRASSVEYLKIVDEPVMAEGEN